MKMFFKTRKEMRNFKSGKAVDLGPTAKKRWAREFKVESKG